MDLNSFQVATSETARDINRRIVLNLLRTRQPLSRADLARHSGLQRSTVSVIVEQLISEQWVNEGAIGHLPRGRRPRFLQINDERAGVVGINVRPAQTTIAIANLNAQFLAQEQMPTASDPRQFVDELTQRAKAFVKAHADVSIEGVGVSLPGRVDCQTQRLTFAPNLGWRDLDLKTPLERATGLPVELENAANACALAEIWFGGNLENSTDLVSVTVSEGIGTGIVIDGQLMRGPTGEAGEFGHVSINEDGPLCKCGNRGCWETYASNSAAIDFYLQATSKARHGKKDYAPNGNQTAAPSPSFEDLLRLSEQGNVQAREAIERMAKYLGVGIAMLSTSIAPRVIIIVGEVTRVWNSIEPIINKVVAERLPNRGVPKIIPANDAAQPRLRGTIALVLQKHFGAPAIA
ncbi:MAG: ROK family transcriptional regulator [Pyrinomonadaceae bacterium]|nr:ROK family transcriptional regulator [Pyrinomonadaceae bacterium]